MNRPVRAVLALCALLACTRAVAEPDFTLRVVNGRDGPVQVRLAGESDWVTLGHVKVPANRTASGFGAARWSQRATVSAVAVHGIRLKVGTGEFPALFSLVPRQFSNIPEFYGGHIPGDSGIRTDIGAGKGIFREWAPLAGSPLALEVGGGEMALPADYRPAAGDVVLIHVTYPRDSPREIVFENRAGGDVTATNPDGTSVKIGTVAAPVRGVGRFDGTSYTGVGAVNTNHPGVITISTAPAVETERSEGAPPERRGGFMISPSTHAGDQAKGMPQVMSVAPLPGEPDWEGRFPLFAGAIGLPSGPAGFRVDMRVNGEWEPLPTIVGRDDEAFTGPRLARILKRDVPATGAAAFRLHLPPWDAGAARQRLETARRNAPKPGKEPTGVYRLVKGTTPVSAVGARGNVTFLVDGVVRAASNDPGYRWQWDTTKDANGRHWVEVVSRSGAHETRRLMRVLVLNPSRP